MSSEEEKAGELIAYLKKAGFEGALLEEDIHRGIEKGSQRFSTDHVIPKGEEQMRFRINFEWDPQFGSYRLTGYRATHRDPVIISHKTIEGIHTALLEEQMKLVDRVSWFGNNEQPGTALVLPEPVEKGFTALENLSRTHSYDARQILDELYYKYLPANAYNDVSMGEQDWKVREDLKKEQIKSRMQKASVRICRTPKRGRGI